MGALKDGGVQEVSNKWKERRERLTTPDYYERRRVIDYDFSLEDVKASKAACERHPGKIAIRSVTWFVPAFKHPYFGGIHTILRFAAHMKSGYGVASRFVISNLDDIPTVQNAIGLAFSILKESPVQAVSRPAEL